jgi:hypothetical protein
VDCLADLGDPTRGATSADMVAAGAAAAEIGPASLAREPVVLIEKYRLFTGRP